MVGGKPALGLRAVFSSLRRFVSGGVFGITPFLVFLLCYTHALEVLTPVAPNHGSAQPRQCAVSFSHLRAIYPHGFLQ